MVALHCTAAGTALDSYRRTRRLVEELGIEPGPELRTARQAVLRSGPALRSPARIPA